MTQDDTRGPAPVAVPKQRRQRRPSPGDQWAAAADLSPWRRRGRRTQIAVGFMIGCALLAAVAVLVGKLCVDAYVLVWTWHPGGRR